MTMFMRIIILPPSRLNKERGTEPAIVRVVTVFGCLGKEELLLPPSYALRVDNVEETILIHNLILSLHVATQVPLVVLIHIELKLPFWHLSRLHNLIIIIKLK